MNKFLKTVTYLSTGTLLVALLGCGGVDEVKSTTEATPEVEVESSSVVTESQIKADMAKAMGDVQKTIMANPKMSKEEQKKLVVETLVNSDSMKSQFAKQKEMMPKMVKFMKVNRACLQDANSKDDAKVCEKKAERIAKELGFDDEFSEEGEEEEFHWDKAEKKKVLLGMDEGIKEMEKNLPCLEKAKNMMDLMQCTKVEE